MESVQGGTRTLVHSTVDKVLRNHNLSNAKMVVALSGGIDSLTLLFSLFNLASNPSITLHVAHLNHGLRGDDSDADARFVADTCEIIGVGFTTEVTDVKSLMARKQVSTETAAREARYEFLGRVAEEQRAEAVMVGHTSDDQVETVLMNIIRGSGLVGLRGIGEYTVREISGRPVTICRPLLSLSRNDTEKYCSDLELRPRTDESNFSMDPSRNRIRMELLPSLEKYNPKVKNALFRLSGTASAHVSYIETQVDQIWDQVATDSGQLVSIRRDMFASLDPAIQASILRKAVSLVKGDVMNLEHVHIDDMITLTNGPSGKILNLPCGLRFFVDSETATLDIRGESHDSEIHRCERHSLTVPGEIHTPEWTITTHKINPCPKSSLDWKGYLKDTYESADNQLETNNPMKTLREDTLSSCTGFMISPHRLSAHLDLDSIGTKLEVRPREQGDRFQPLGMIGHKKLQDFMVDEKIPRRCRDRIPLVISSRGVAWVVGRRIADWAKITNNTSHVVAMRFKPRL